MTIRSPNCRKDGLVGGGGKSGCIRSISRYRLNCETASSPSISGRGGEIGATKREATHGAAFVEVLAKLFISTIFASWAQCTSSFQMR